MSTRSLPDRTVTTEPQTPTVHALYSSWSEPECGAKPNAPGLCWGAPAWTGDVNCPACLAVIPKDDLGLLIGIAAAAGAR